VLGSECPSVLEDRKQCTRPSLPDQLFDVYDELLRSCYDSMQNIASVVQKCNFVKQLPISHSRTIILRLVMIFCYCLLSVLEGNST
jgi:predicted membrane chloride channel (bestrophin family)